MRSDMEAQLSWLERMLHTHEVTGSSPVVSTTIEDLCNGSTPDSDSVCGGSNPSSSAIRFTLDSSESRGFFLILFAFEVQIVLNFKGGFFVSLTFSLISLRT